MIALNNEVLQLLNELRNHSLDTYRHSLRVANLCASFGEKIGLSNDDIEKLYIAGILHDIGKLKVPLTILDKPAKLTDSEYEIVKNHPIYGASLLLQSGFKNMEILNLVACHHERLDGLGYPQGLDRNSLPKLERIVTICDSYDAMNTNRPYQKGRNFEYIQKEYLDNADTQFDSQLVKLFLAYLEEQNKTKSKKEH